MQENSTEANLKPVPKSDLEKSLDDYTDIDVLDKDNLFICNHCNKESMLAAKYLL